MADDSHSYPAKEWQRITADAAKVRRALRAGHANASHLLSSGAAKLGPSSFPSVTGFLQCKYDGGAQPSGGVKFGVLHDAETPLTAGYAQSIASYFTRNINQTSAHFMVDPVATYQMLDTSHVAWHCGNGNTRSIGVEQAGYASFSAPSWQTDAGVQQMGRIAELMREIHTAYGIGLYWMTDQQLIDAHAGRIVGGWATHSQCSRVLGGSTHTDPMPSYPLAALMTVANQEDDMPLTAADIIAIRNAVWNTPFDDKGNIASGYAWASTRDAGVDTKTGRIESKVDALANAVSKLQAAVDSLKSSAPQ